MGGGRGGVVGKLLDREGNGQREKACRQSSKKKKKNETQPSHVFVKSLGLMQTVLGLIFFFLHRKAVQMFLRAGLRFPCFPFARLFPALQRCQDAALLGAGVFVFPESGTPTEGSSPGQLQMRNSWPAALAATQIRPFEKITVLLLPPPPVGHARFAEGRGMCRRAGRGREGGTGGPHFIRPLSESFSHYFSSPSPPQMFQFALHRTGRGLFPNKPRQGFST